MRSIWMDLIEVDFAVRRTTVTGLQTRSLVAGQGPPVVFLHGTSGHLEAFSRNVRAHVDAGYSCHLVDLMGHGRTEGRNGVAYEIPLYVDHLRGYIAEQNLGRVNLVGESLGGWVSAWLTSEYPAEVTTLQLVAAGGTRAVPEVMERIRKSTLLAVRSDNLDVTRSRLELLLHDPAKDLSEELVQVRHHLYHRAEFVQNIENLLCLQQMDVRTRNLLSPERLNRLAQVPTLIVWGNQNPFGDVPEAVAMKENIPGSELVIFPECGHWPQHEWPERFNDLSIGFLDSHNARPVGP
jgi:2-hydroxy-6-oxonona-2,4-dienedioate hydrolase